MKRDPGQALAVLNALPAIVRRGNTAQEVVDDIARTVGGKILSLWRVSLRRILPGHQQMEFVAVWSAAPTRIEPGLRVSVGATSLPEVLKLDRPVFSVERGGEAPHLLEQVLASEGASSWVAIPLHRGGTVVGLLNFSSFAADGITAEDLGFYEQLGRRVGERLVELMEQSTLRVKHD